MYLEMLEKDVRKTLIKTKKIGFNFFFSCWMEIHVFNSRERLFHALVRTVEVIFPFQPCSSF